MIGTSSFWQTETGAPLLRRNFGFVTKENAEPLVQRAQKLVDFVDDYVARAAAEGERFDVLLSPSAAPPKTGGYREAAAAPVTEAPQAVAEEPQALHSAQQSEARSAVSPSGKKNDSVPASTKVDHMQVSPGKKKNHSEPTSTKVEPTQVSTQATGEKPFPPKAEEHRTQQRAGVPAVAPAAAAPPPPPESSPPLPLSPSSPVLRSCPPASSSPSAEVPISCVFSSASSSPASSSAASSAASAPQAAAAVAVPPAFQRIFALDAERTFRDPAHRRQMEAVLASLHEDVGDYHQGMGFLVAFLMLFLPAEQVQHLVLQLHRHYVPGYFAAAPTAYVRDARVFQKLLQRVNPTVAQHLEKFTCPEAYVSKWFIGMNVHVLPFSALMLFFEKLFQQGDRFLFQFALALVKTLEQLLLQVQDISTILAILRLDAAIFPDSAACHTAISDAVVATAAKKHATSSAVAGGEKSCFAAAAAQQGAAEASGSPPAAAAEGREGANAAAAAAPGDHGEERKSTEEELIPGSFFIKLVEDAAAFDLSAYDIEKLRQEALEEMRMEAERRKEREKQLGLDDDDEIVFSDEEEEEASQENQKREDE